MNQIKIVNSATISTPLGSMIALADERALYFLQFHDNKNNDKQIKKLQKEIYTTVIEKSSNPIIELLAYELSHYFAGTLQKFQTPIHFFGTIFQKAAWRALIEIPYGKTQTYAYQACSIGNNYAYRAIGNANSANSIAIVVPCHRVIASNGRIGGYAGGIERKKWLLEHEKRYILLAQ